MLERKRCCWECQVQSWPNRWTSAHHTQWIQSLSRWLSRNRQDLPTKDKLGVETFYQNELFLTVLSPQCHFDLILNCNFHVQEKLQCQNPGLYEIASYLCPFERSMQTSFCNKNDQPCFSAFGFAYSIILQWAADKTKFLLIKLPEQWNFISFWLLNPTAAICGNSPSFTVAPPKIKPIDMSQLSLDIFWMFASTESEATCTTFWVCWEYFSHSDDYK